MFKTVKHGVRLNLDRRNTPFFPLKSDIVAKPTRLLSKNTDPCIRLIYGLTFYEPKQNLLARLDVKVKRANSIAAMHTMKQVLICCLILSAVAGCRSKAPKLESTNDTMSESNHSSNPYYSRTDTTVLHVSDEEWKKVLPDSVYEVARNADTERAFSGKYWNFEGLGTYYCAACGNKLFRSDSKFSSTCGWPSFFETSRKNSVTYKDDHSYGMTRTEVLCGRCAAHLGHLFDDGPPPTGKRYCMNSLVLDFEPDTK